MPIPAEFSDLVESYLESVLPSPALLKGWKLPETTLIFPWIVRMFPKAYYIHWVRDPRDVILSPHGTDDLAAYGVPFPYDPNAEVHLRRAISWKYQDLIVKATPKPKHWISVRLEDFVLDQGGTLRRLEDFLGFPLVTIPVKHEVIGRYKTRPEHRDFDFLQPALIGYGYQSAA
jgi:hypothetical protein